MSIRNFLFKKSYLDLDYIYGALSNSNGENPLDYPKFMENPMEFFAVATNAETGEVKYFSKADVRQDDYSILKASCAIPFVCRPYEVNGVPYYDGALGDAVPIEKAFAWGCDKVVLILTKPADVLRVPGKDIDFAERIQKNIPSRQNDCEPGPISITEAWNWQRRMKRRESCASFRLMIPAGWTR